MAIEWKVVRIPAALAERIDRIAAELLEAHSRGVGKLPGDYVERVPPHHVIDRAVREMESHRVRARRYRPAKPRRIQPEETM